MIHQVERDHNQLAKCTCIHLLLLNDFAGRIFAQWTKEEGRAKKAWLPLAARGHDETESRRSLMQSPPKI